MKSLWQSDRCLWRVNESVNGFMNYLWGKATRYSLKQQKLQLLNCAHKPLRLTGNFVIEHH